MLLVPRPLDRAILLYLRKSPRVSRVTVAIPPEPLVSRHQNSAVLQYRPDGTLNNGEVYVLRMVEDVDLDLRNYESTSA